MLARLNRSGAAIGITVGNNIMFYYIGRIVTKIKHSYNAGCESVRKELELKEIENHKVNFVENLHKELLTYTRRGDRVGAVRHLRKAFPDYGLREAIDYVDAIKASNEN